MIESLSIEQRLSERNEVQKIIKNNPKWNFDKSWKEFLMSAKYYCTPSSYGTRIQNRIIFENGFKKVDSKKDRGDAYDSGNDDYSEIKVAFMNVKKYYSILQVRLYQNVDYYYLFFINDKYQHSEYKIPKKEFKEITEKYGQACHGTEDSRKNNENIEYRIDFKPSNVEQWSILSKFKINGKTNNNKFWS